MPSPTARSSADPPSVVFLLSGLTVGGAERHTLDLSRKLAARGFRTKVLAMGGRSPGSEALHGAEAVEVLGARRVLAPWSWPKAAAAVRAERPDVVVAVNQATGLALAALRAAGALRRPTACIFHTTEPRPRDRLAIKLLGVCSSVFDALVFVSRNQQAYWSTRGLAPPTATAIVNGVDLARFEAATQQDKRAAKQALDLPPDAPVIGLLAAFRPEKNHGQLVEAFSSLQSQRPDARLLFVGDGETRADVERRVATLGLQDRVVFAGQHADVRPLVAAFDLGVLCSTAVETFSLAALELLAMGVPMVMSDIGGASEIVTPGQNGALFPAGDVKALAAALADALEPTALARLAANARPSVERYSEAAMLDRYDALFRSLSSAA